MTELLHELLYNAAESNPDAVALRCLGQSLSYGDLATSTLAVASVYLDCNVARHGRIAIFLDKCFETVCALFGAAAAGAVFVPINPVLKPEQVSYILRDCGVHILVTTAERHALLCELLANCPDIHTVIIVGSLHAISRNDRIQVLAWDDVIAGGSAGAGPKHPTIDLDMAAILYTSGSTGKPKGVVLSHRNLVAGATSVARYLENRPSDRILSVLPLSFDAGFSQLTTAFHVGATVVLLNYLLPRDVVLAVLREKISGITAVPPLWIQIAQQDWGRSNEHLRYIANTGGHMPRATLNALRSRLPKTAVYLMYGLTEAFRSTYLSPEQVDRRPDSIGKAIPNAEILVVREDGTPCAAGEPGELVHRGALVSLGYWNDPEKTAERFRPAPGQPDGIVTTELAVWSGDTVRTDEEGFIYFVGRRDEMIKTSGYRVSPTEVEEVIYATGDVAEAAAIGIPHPILGQAIVVVAVPASGNTESFPELLLSKCRARLPSYMVPAHISTRLSSLPRNPNGKVDRKSLSLEFADLFTACAQ